MTIECYCDYDAPTIYRTKIVRSRRPHRCSECGGHIAKDERYEYLFGVWDGSPGSFYTCARCVDLRTWVKNNVPCLCIMHGDMDEQMRNAVQDAYDRARKEAGGLWFGFQRRLIARRRHNEAARKALAI